MGRLNGAPALHRATWVAARVTQVPLRGPIRCLHLAPTAVHLALGEGRAVSLVAEPNLAGPCAAVVPSLFLGPATALRAELASGGVADGGSLRFPAAVIDLSGAVVGSARPAWRAVRGARPLREQVSEPQARLRCASDFDDLAWVLVEAAALADALWAADASPFRARDVARRLIGRGPGLTPAGDDLLVGAFHGVWALGLDDRECERRCRRALGSLGASTTALSRTWLDAAAAGEAVAPWQALLDAWAGGDPRGLARAVAGVVAIGASSGRAMLEGFGAVLRRAEQGAQPVG